MTPCRRSYSPDYRRRRSYSKSPSHGRSPACAHDYDITTPEPQFINQVARGEHDLNTLMADHSAGDEGQLSISVPSQIPQLIDQDVKDEHISILGQASRSYEGIRSEEDPSITLSQGPSNFQTSERNATLIRNGGEYA